MRLLVLMTLLTACTRSRSPSTGEVRVVHDALGRALRVPPHPNRVISLAPSSTEILFAIGAGQAVIGVDAYSDYPAGVSSRTKVGSDLQPSLEKMLALRPEIVFTATSANSEKTVSEMEGAGLSVFVSRTLSLADIYRDIHAIGEAMNRLPDAAVVEADLRNQLDGIHAQVARLPQVPTAVVVWPDPLMVAGAGSHVNDLVELAGGVNVAADSPQAFPAFSVERLLGRAPEVLIVGTHAQGGAPPLQSLMRLTALPAVRNHRVVIVDGNLLFRPGPRIVDGARALLEAMHPELARSDGGTR